MPNIAKIIFLGYYAVRPMFKWLQVAFPVATQPNTGGLVIITDNQETLAKLLASLPAMAEAGILRRAPECQDDAIARLWETDPAVTEEDPAPICLKAESRRP